MIWNLIATESDLIVQFSLIILLCTQTEIRMVLEEVYKKIHKNHREIREQTVKSFYIWLHSKSIRGNFALMIFTKHKNIIVCEKEILQINHTYFIK